MFRRERERRRRRRVAVVLALLICGLGAWGWGLSRFVDSIPRTVADDQRRTDAIVVLTGGTMRLETGFALLAAGMAETLLVSGVDKSVPIEEVLRLTGMTEEDVACCVTLGYMAEDTGSNASESAAWVRSNGIRSVRLVTAGYHMPRSLLEFRAALPDVEIVPHPVFPAHVMIDEWWRRPGTASLLIGEYNKFLLAGLRTLAGFGAEG
ncbi:MAG: YdcF family protein [Rhodospirillales bacterium]|nr:MAG: YdcF family protein [Rhodospirillales bacterium]